MLPYRQSGTFVFVAFFSFLCTLFWVIKFQAMNLHSKMFLFVAITLLLWGACHPDAPKTNSLVQNWHLNDSKETGSEWLGNAQIVDLNMQLNNNNTLILNRTKGSRKDVIIGTWQQTKQRLHLQFNERKTYMLVRDINNRDQVAEENLQSSQALNTYIEFIIEKNTSFLLKLKNDTLAYTFVPKI